MTKTLRIAWHAYRQNVFRFGFLFFNFGLPVLYALALGVVVFFVMRARESDRRPIGVVDLAAVLQWPAPGGPARPGVEAVRFGDEAAARRALEAGEVQAYYVLPADYLGVGTVIEVSLDEVDSGVRDQVRALLRDSLLEHTSPENRLRISGGTRLLHRTPGAEAEFTAQYALKQGLVWGMLAVFYLASAFTNSYLMESLTEEHANRTIEILLASVRPEQFLAGKVLGMVVLGLTPLIVWGMLAGLTAALAVNTLRLVGLDPALSIPWGAVGLSLLLFVPAFVLNTTVSAVVGAMVGLSGQSLQLLSLLTGLMPLAWGPAALAALNAPDSALAIGLSLFPLTAPVALPIRTIQVVVPYWQTAVSVGLLWLTMLAGLRLSARLYRAAWLMMGQKNRLRILWLALAGKS